MALAPLRFARRQALRLIPLGAIMIVAPDAPPPALHAPRASYAEILEGRAGRLAVHALASNPRVLVFDYPSLRAQAEALNRVAALIEKRGAPRDRILTPAQLSAFLKATHESFDTFYVGHNYSAAKLAAFFDMAGAQTVALNAREAELRRLAVRYGLIGRAGAAWRPVPPAKALVSIVQPGPGMDAALRETTLRHELSHGAFATIAAYRAYCIRFWRDTLDAAERAAFRRFIAARGYDTANERLVLNEAQAYLAHTPDARAFSARLLGLPKARVARMRAKFWSGLARIGLRARLDHGAPAR